MIRQPPEDRDPAAFGGSGGSSTGDRAWPGGATPEPDQTGRLPAGDRDEPTRRLPEIPERFTPGRASPRPPVPARASEAPVTSPYPVSYPVTYPDPYPVEGEAYPPVPATTNSLAIWSLVCSILGVFTCFALSPIGVLLGHLARRRIRRTGEPGEGLAVGAIVLGWIGVAMLVLCCGAVMVIARSLGLDANTGLRGVF